MATISTPQRLIALDVFRGLTIALMFTVNNPGTWSFIYDPLEHAKWSGWTPTDFVFPFFLFTVGVSAWFALKKYQKGASRELYNKIIRRGTMIFLIGLGLNLYLNNLSSYQNLRIMGVLQRIGIAYMVGSILCVSVNRRTLAYITVGILLGYWGLMYFFNDIIIFLSSIKWLTYVFEWLPSLSGDPNYPYGFHDGHKYFGLEGNIVTQIDYLILGKSHLYKGYDGIPFDPEGLLSTIPAIASVILGYFTGLLIDSKSNRKELVNYMFLYGFGALLIGYIWNFAFPINKPIWSSSYVVFMAGWCLVINAVLIWLIDIQNLRSWTKPVLVLGMNSMLAFVISGMYVKTAAKFKFDSSYETITQKWDNQTVPKRIATGQKLYEDVFCPMTTDRQMMLDYKAGKIKKEIDPSVFHDFEERQKLSSFLFALFHVALFWAILWVFYKFNIFLKI